MTIETTLAAGRAFVASQRGFPDTCTIHRRMGEPVTHPLTGEVSQSMQLIYSGVCRFQQAGANAGNSNIGEAGVGLLTVEVHLPVVGSEGITKDDVCVCVTSTNDADLVGKSFAVQGAHHATHKTARRLPLLDVIG